MNIACYTPHCLFNITVGCNQKQCIECGDIKTLVCKAKGRYNYLFTRGFLMLAWCHSTNVQSSIIMSYLRLKIFTVTTTITQDKYVSVSLDTFADQLDNEIISLWDISEQINHMAQRYFSNLIKNWPFPKFWMIKWDFYMFYSRRVLFHRIKYRTQKPIQDFRKTVFSLRGCSKTECILRPEME